MASSSGAETVRIVLELDPGSDRPSGRLVDEHGSERDFVGWLALMDGVESARDRAAPSEPPDRSREEPGP
jgi:hypothetical protein